MNREPSTPNKAARIVAGIVALGTIGLLSEVMSSSASNTNCDFEGCPPVTNETGSTVTATLPDKEATTVAPTTTVVESSVPASSTTTTVAETPTIPASTTTVPATVPVPVTAPGHTA